MLYLLMEITPLLEKGIEFVLTGQTVVHTNCADTANWCAVHDFRAKVIELTSTTSFKGHFSSFLFTEPLFMAFAYKTRCKSILSLNLLGCLHSYTADNNFFFYCKKE